MIFDSSEPSQTILVDIDLEGVTRGHQNIDTKIKLKAINQKWLRKGGRMKQFILP